MFRFRLAKALGKTVEEMDNISTNELAYWIAYDDVEGLEPDGSWRQNAQLCLLLAQLLSTDKRVQSMKPEHFMPRRVVKPNPQTPDEQRAMLNLMFKKPTP